MVPADIVKVDRLADAVCHDEQLTIWEDELIWALADRLLTPTDYDDMIAFRRQLRRAIQDLVESAFSHPEILGIEGTSNRK